MRASIPRTVAHNGFDQVGLSMFMTTVSELVPILVRPNYTVDSGLSLLNWTWIGCERRQMSPNPLNLKCPSHHPPHLCLCVHHSTPANIRDSNGAHYLCLQAETGN
ncbi:hypothetical protein OPV22_006299 [Ensete ventricosum]|uniref:Uncharacterized protein n=1 Tax=Ensete ventricosum TaxID=4639 RepID=A0AAV8RIG8_ENSVE|nr:hypothetical protein OPV22_006299 [Ensete ventricosum]